VPERLAHDPHAYGPTGDTGDDKLVAAIDYAIANGARIINASWGGPEETDLLREGMERARDAGVLVVAAAGNLHQNMDLFPGYPAAYRMPNVLSVGATTNLDGVARFSQRGGEAVDLLAQGIRCSLARAAGGYRFGSGTSFAERWFRGRRRCCSRRSPHSIRIWRRAGLPPPWSNLAASEQCRSHGRSTCPRWRSRIPRRRRIEDLKSGGRAKRRRAAMDRSGQ
jgi:subtilisin family serine protease